VSVVILIRASPIIDMNSEYENLPYCAEIRWPSCRMMLQESHDLTF